MHARVPMKLDATRAQVHLFFILLPTDVAQQTAQHREVQLFVAGGLLVQHPALLFHHGQELAVHIAPLAPTSDVDEVLAQQVLVLAVGQFVRARLVASGGLQPIP